MKKIHLLILIFTLFVALPTSVNAQSNRFYLSATIDYEGVTALDIMEFQNVIVVYSFAKADEAQAALEILKKNENARIKNGVSKIPSEDGSFKIQAFKEGSLLIWVKDKRYASKVYNGRQLSSGMNIVVTPANRPQKTENRLIVNQNENSISDTLLQNIDVVEKKKNVKKKASSSQDEGGTMTSSTTIYVPFRVRDNMRIVVQPLWYDRVNALDEKSDTVFSYGHAFYCDVDEYSLTQTRLMDYDLTNDSLYNLGNPELLFKKELADGEMLYSNVSFTPDRDTIIVSIIDTLSGYDPDVSHPYPFGAIVAVADYNSKLKTHYEKDDGERKSSLKFLDFKFNSYLPEKEKFVELIDDEPTDVSGELRLNFENGKAVLSMNDTVNVNELNKLKNLLKEIEEDEFRFLLMMDVYGVASPEGNLASNERLARDRAEYARTQILRFTDRPVNIAQTKVAGWDEVSKLLRADSLFSKADTIDAIIASTKGIEAQNQVINKLPFYQLLKDVYLPKLRVVRYSYMESKPSQPAPEQLLEAFRDKDRRKNLRHGHYWILFNYIKDNRLLEEVARVALEETRSQDEDSVYSKGYWPYAACLLSTCYIARDTFDLNLLSPFLETTLVKNETTNEMEIQHLRDWWPSRIHKRITKGAEYDKDEYRIVRYVNFPEFAANQLVMLLRNNKRLDFNYVSALEDIMDGQGLQYDTLAAISKCLRGGYKETSFTSEAQAAHIRSIVENSSVTNSVVINLAMDEPDDADSTYFAVAEFKAESLPDNAVSDYLKAIIKFRKGHFAEADSLLASSFVKDVNMIRIANNDKDLLSHDRTRFVVSGALPRWYAAMKETVGNDERNAFAWYSKAIEELSKGQYADVEKSKEYMSRCFTMDKRYKDVLGVVLKRDSNIKSNTLLLERLNEIRN